MTKTEQMSINAKVLEVMAAAEKEYSDLRNIGYTDRLYTCNASYFYTPNYIVLRSYRTIVAVIDTNGVCYDFLRKVYGYTATTAQHITKFARKFEVVKKLTYKDI